MTTDRLIGVLSANLEPVALGELRRTIIVAIISSGAAAFGLMLITVGLRSEIGTVAHLKWLALKLLIAMSLIVTGVPPLIRSLRPGQDDSIQVTQVCLCFLVVSFAAIAIQLFSPAAEWREMFLGPRSVSSARCLQLILFFAAIPLTLLMWTLRRGAPTRLQHCGAIAGVVAGAIGAGAYACNCAGDSVPFIAIWYSTAIAICAFVGAYCGPRFLRW